MEEIWKFLPTDLVRKILNMADLAIDTRLYFKLENKKINFKNIFWPRPSVVYDNASRTMFDFTGLTDDDLPFWIIRKNIKFSQFRSPNTHVFNMEWDPYEMTMFSDDYILGPSECRNHIVFRENIKFIQ
jgi:hypothetical protein